MKIVSCHIENFGKLSGVSLSFQKGCNVIFEENGWGKSTLAAFIRVMLFGFAEEKARDDLKNERKRYRPWQGGVYGGQLEFETGGETYRITRTFGAKKKDDRFSLRRADTNLESGRFSENVGEELFSLDCASFCRTVFISQNDCETTSTDGINAKIGNLADDTDDINNYEAVNRKLQDLLNKMSPTRSTGSLYRMKNEIGRLEENVRAGRGIDQTMEEIRRKLSQRTSEQQSLKREQEELLQKQQEIGAYKDIQGKLEVYTALCEEYRLRKGQVDEEKSYFPDRVPKSRELEEMIAESARLSVAEERADFHKMTAEEEQQYRYLQKLFGRFCPTEEMLREQGEKLKELQEIRVAIATSRLPEEELDRLNAYERQFREDVPTQQRLEEVIDLYTRCADKKKVLDQKRDTLAALQELSGGSAQGGAGRSRRGARGLGILLGTAVAVAGLLCAVFTAQKQIGVAAAVTGILFCIWSFLRRRKRRGGNGQREKGADRLEREIAEDERFIREAEEETERFLADYGYGFQEGRVLETLYELKNDIREYVLLLKKEQSFQGQDFAERRRKIIDELHEFLYVFFPDIVLREEDLLIIIDEMKGQVREYERLREKDQNADREDRLYGDTVDRVKAFLASLSMEPEPDLQGQLTDIQHHLQSLLVSYAEYRKIRAQKEEFEAAEDVSELMEKAKIKDDDALEGINGRLAEIASQLEFLYGDIADYNRQLNDLREAGDRGQEDGERLMDLRREYDEGMRRYEILRRTRELLEQAKTSLTARYTGPIRESFGRYYEMLSNEGEQRYHFDANNDVTIDEKGMQREPRFFSAGYRDMIGICMRMALVDAMYQEEKPFVLFDDPFANLDGDKTEGALKFLQEISARYQVLYFTCHESRLPDV